MNIFFYYRPHVLSVTCIFFHKASFKFFFLNHEKQIQPKVGKNVDWISHFIDYKIQWRTGYAKTN